MDGLCNSLCQALTQIQPQFEGIVMENNSPSFLTNRLIKEPFTDRFPSTYENKVQKETHRSALYSSLLRSMRYGYENYSTPPTTELLTFVYGLTAKP